jgi:succinoglycan biosynthesis protein ExoA
VAAFGQGHTHLIRVDAHSLYPDDFVDMSCWPRPRHRRGLGRGRHDRGGRGGLQRLNAETQNARIGNGGSRIGRGGRAASSITAITR